MLTLLDSPYSQVTDELYSVWPGFKADAPGARLGGFYAFKEGFHSSVEDNLEHWPGNYSIRDAINRRAPRDKARAIDLSLSRSQMVRRTGYLRDAAADDDPRLRCVREFYGTLDARTVFGRAHTGPDTGWRSSSADSSHLWHIHISIFTPYVDDLEAMAGLVSVLKGESLDDYLSGGTMERNLAEYGDSGTWVGFFQRYLKSAGATVDVDNEWGPQTTAAAKWWFVNVAKGDPKGYDGRAMTSWIARELIRRDNAAITQAAIKAALAEALADLPTAPAATPEQINTAVADYLRAHPPKDGVDGKTPTKVRVLLDADVVAAS